MEAERKRCCSFKANGLRRKRGWEPDRPWERAELVYGLREKSPQKRSSWSYGKESMTDVAVPLGNGEWTKYRRTHPEGPSKQIQWFGESQT